MNPKDNKEDIINPDDYFPKIKWVKDNHGNKLENPVNGEYIDSPKVLREGDVIEIHCEATDPLKEDLEYKIGRLSEQEWSKENKRTINLERRDIGRTSFIRVMMRSKRDYHAYSDYDYYAEIRYVVVPKQI